MDHSHHTALPTGELIVDLTILFTLGVTMSLGHCVGMCGPLQSAIFMQVPSGVHSGSGKLLHLFTYHLGRVLSYVILGLLFALTGGLAAVAGVTPRIQGMLAIVAGVLMVSVALGLLGVFPSSRWLEFRWAGSRIQKVILAGLSRGQRGWFGLGIANGFLPCGPVLAVALSAATAPTVTAGMVKMASYGLGTVPVLVGMGLAASQISARTRLRFYRLAGALVIVLAAQIILRGLTGLGVVESFHIGPVMLW